MFIVVVIGDEPELVEHVELLDEIPTNWTEGWLNPWLVGHGARAVRCYQGNVNGGDVVEVFPSDEA